MPSIKEMNDNTTDVTEEQRAAAMSTVQVSYREEDTIDAFADVAAYQLLGNTLIIADKDGTTVLLPMERIAQVIIRQNKE